jgi:hypothetical protein
MIGGTAETSTHQGDVSEIQRLDHGGKIVGIAVHVIAGRGLARSAMTATVVRDHPKAVLCQEQHLAVPGVGVQRPAVREGDDRAGAPVLVVDLGAVLGGDRAHRVGSFALVSRAIGGEQPWFDLLVASLRLRPIGHLTWSWPADRSCCGDLLIVPAGLLGTRT